MEPTRPRGARRQVRLPEEVDQATTQQVAVAGLGDGNGYGYQWWTGTVDGDEAFQAMGYGGQLIEVIPGRDLVVVTTASGYPRKSLGNLDALEPRE